MSKCPEVNSVSSGHHVDRLSKGVSVSKVKDGNCINFDLVGGDLIEINELIKSNRLPDRHLIKAAVFGALHNAGQWWFSPVKLSLSIRKKLTNKKPQDFICLSDLWFLTDFNWYVCQMFLYCQGNVISILVRLTPLTSHRPAPVQSSGPNVFIVNNIQSDVPDLKNTVFCWFWNVVLTLLYQTYFLNFCLLFAHQRHES